jgi:hypothetical protein
VTFPHRYKPLQQEREERGGALPSCVSSGCWQGTVRNVRKIALFAADVGGSYSVFEDFLGESVGVIYTALPPTWFNPMAMNGIGCWH